MTTAVKPEVLNDEHLTFLDDLRESGETNMYGARPYLMRAFPELTANEAMEVCTYWMRTFGSRHPA